LPVSFEEDGEPPFGFRRSDPEEESLVALFSASPVAFATTSPGESEARREFKNQNNPTPKTTHDKPASRIKGIANVRERRGIAGIPFARAAGVCDLGPEYPASAGTAAGGAGLGFNPVGV
jgi:hypothetical protein